MLAPGFLSGTGGSTAMKSRVAGRIRPFRSPAFMPISLNNASSTGCCLEPTPRALAARARAGQRWYVYLIVCRGGAIYTGIALDVAARYALHAAGTGARYTRANPPERLLAKFACKDQSVASRMEAAIKSLPAAAKMRLAGMTAAAARKALLRHHHSPDSQAASPAARSGGQ